MANGRFAWVLNLDADLELAVVDPRTRYTPKRTVRDAMAPFVALLARSLLGPEDVLIDDWADDNPEARGMAGRAFCPTPRAIAVMERAGAVPEAHPSVDVLRRVNGRAFASDLGQTLPNAAYVRDFETACAKLASGARPWRVKRSFGMTGRGQRVIGAGAATDADLAFVRAGLEEGGVQVEPNMAIETEYGLHAMLAEDGALSLGSLVTQRCDSRGAWIATERACGPEEILATLTDEARLVAGALHDAGYFGPFGIDAYTYRAEDGDVVLQRRSEINARYSMGFAIGYGQ